MSASTFSRLLLRFGIASSLLGAGLAGCAADTMGGTPGTNTTATNEDGDDAPLADVGELLEGAPDNAGLPDEGKADAVYPATYSELLATQSPVQSQGSRGVCSIFATVGLMEHLYIAEGSRTDLNFSEQFLQWSAKAELGEFTHTEGSSGDANLRAISRFGVVLENDWPYETQPWGVSNDEACGGEENQRPVRCFTNGDPPAAALAAQRYNLPRGRWISSRTRSIKAHMFDNHTAVLVGGTFYYQSWNHRRSTLPTNQDNWRMGIVLPPNDEDRRVSLEKRAGHAFVLVGWDDNMEVQQRDAMGNGVVDADGQPVMERGFFIFKNSWGTGSFGINNPHGAGFGFIAYRYVEELSANVSGLPTPPRLREACGNGADDDRDGLSDCADSDCAMDPACMPAGGPTTYRSTQVVDIPDNTAAGIRSDIEVTDAGAARAIRVTVDITHPYRGDLKIALVRNGTEVVLLDEQGGGEDNVQQTFTIDRFLGEDAAGTWTLAVIDGAAQDVGVLRSWSIEVAR